jgi:hypothetical protein
MQQLDCNVDLSWYMRNIVCVTWTCPSILMFNVYQFKCSVLKKNISIGHVHTI